MKFEDADHRPAPALEEHLNHVESKTRRREPTQT